MEDLYLHLFHSFARFPVSFYAIYNNIKFFYLWCGKYISCRLYYILHFNLILGVIIMPIYIHYTQRSKGSGQMYLTS